MLLKLFDSLQIRIFSCFKLGLYSLRISGCLFLFFTQFIHIFTHFFEVFSGDIHIFPTLFVRMRMLCRTAYRTGLPGLQFICKKTRLLIQKMLPLLLIFTVQCQIAVPCLYVNFSAFQSPFSACFCLFSKRFCILKFLLEHLFFLFFCLCQNQFLFRLSQFFTLFLP